MRYLLLLLLVGCEPVPPTWEDDLTCRDRAYDMGSWYTATCRPDQEMVVDREALSQADRFEDEERVALVKCVCRL